MSLRWVVGFDESVHCECLIPPARPRRLHAPSKSGFANQPRRQLMAIAVDDSTGDIYVITNSLKKALPQVSRFRLHRRPKNFTAGPASGTNKLVGFGFPLQGAGQVAVDSGGGRWNLRHQCHLGRKSSKIPANRLTSTRRLEHFRSGAFAAPCGVAVDQSTGNVYVGDFGGFVWRYTPSGGSIAETDASGGITTPTATCNVAAARASSMAPTAPKSATSVPITTPTSPLVNRPRLPRP